MIRTTIFWIHLVCGVTTGLVVLMMSVTGVLLTYERQILAYAERHGFPIEGNGATRLPLEAIVAAARQQRPDFAPATIMLRNEADAPITLGGGRSGNLFANPYSGAVAEPGAQGLRRFFGAMTGWHRWFNVDGDGRAAARAVTGASNLAFLFLVLSGMYLWLPRMGNRRLQRTCCSAPAMSGRARLQLAPRVRHLVGRAARGRRGHGDGVLVSLGQRSRLSRVRRGTARAWRSTRRPPSTPVAIGEWGLGTGPSVLGLDELFSFAATHGDWRTLTLTLPTDAAATTARFAIDAGNGGQPQLRHTLTLDATTGAAASYAPFSSQTSGQQARSWVRFLHTGEALGIVGQTIAGLVSLTSVIMVWTGLALAWRRLIAPLFRRRSTTPA
jgi:uncharacterized iron-regulated membrane protein